MFPKIWPVTYNSFSKEIWCIKNSIFYKINVVTNLECVKFMLSFSELENKIENNPPNSF